MRRVERVCLYTPHQKRVYNRQETEMETRIIVIQIQQCWRLKLSSLITPLRAFTSSTTQFFYWIQWNESLWDVLSFFSFSNIKCSLYSLLAFTFLCNSTINELKLFSYVTSMRRLFTHFSSISLVFNLGVQWAFCEMLFWYLQEVNKTLSYLRQYWDKDFGLLMGMAYHKHLHLAALSSLIEPSGQSRIDMSKRFVLIQDQSLLVVRSRSKLMSNWLLLRCWLHRWSEKLLPPPHFEMFAKALQGLKRQAEFRH